VQEMFLNTKRLMITQGAMMVPYIIIMAITISLYNINFGTYGEVAYNETKEWNSKAITGLQVVSNGDSCPKDYTMLTSLYLGTETFCDVGMQNYRLGPCSTNKYSRGRTIYGFPDTYISSFEGKSICYQRGSETYHDIVESRIAKGSCPSG
jgi:hypothetical protein